MIQYILSRCSFLSFGASDSFDYAVDLQKCHVIQVFLQKFSSLAYYAIVRASYFNNERLVEEVSRFLCTEHREAAFLKAYQYGIIYQNSAMINFAAKELNLKTK